MTQRTTPLLVRLIPNNSGDPEVHLRAGIIDAVNTDGTVDLDIGGVVIADVPCLDGLVVGEGEVVQVAARAGVLLVLGRLRPADSSDTLSFRPGKPIYYTSSGTFEKADYPGLRAIQVECIGGGGAGGGATTTGSAQLSAGGGGGGGGYAMRLVPVSDLDTSEAVTVGASVGGSTGSAGSDGNDSVFDTISGPITANGGGGGAIGSAQAGGGSFTVLAGAGGSASGGDLVLGGDTGKRGIYANVSSPRGGGEGGAAARGGGGGTPNGGGSTGGAGRAYGGGGSGASNPQNSGTARAGGTGVAGIVIVTPYF